MPRRTKRHSRPRWDRDDGHRDQAADHRGQGALHARADDDGVDRLEIVADGEQAVQAGDADVVEAGDAGAKGLRGDSGLFRDGNVAGAGADDGDVTPGHRGG